MFLSTGLQARFHFRKITLALALAALAASSTTALALAPATPIATPAGLNVGDPFYVVFITNGTGNALSADVATYDAIAASDAFFLRYHGSPVSFKALVSVVDNPSTAPVDIINAVDRFNPAASVGIYLIDGTKVANDGAQFWGGTLFHSIDLTPSLATITADSFTGTDSSGHASTSASFLGPTQAVGNGGYTAASNTAATSAGWTEGGWGPATDTHHFYAFSEVLVAPEPASLTLMVGSATLLLRRRVRRTA